MHDIKALGWTDSVQTAIDSIRSETPDLEAARVVCEQRAAYRVHAAGGELDAEIAGRLRHETTSREELPAVGDWVAIRPRPGEGRATIHRVLPRRSALVRKVADRRTDGQVLAANLDHVFLVTSLNRDFNPRRIERSLAMVWESGAQPVVVLSKADLQDPGEVQDWCDRAEAVAVGAPVVALSALRGEGLALLDPYLAAGTTVALVGSSGVGKSTLANALAGADVMDTGGIREDDGRGRHTTTHRQLVLLPNGAMLLDTPGLREIALWDSGEALDRIFADVEELQGQCRFTDCSHDGEPGCAIEGAVRDGTLEPGHLENYRKLQRELAHLDRRKDQRATLEHRQKWKKLAKAYRARTKDMKRRREG